MKKRILVVDDDTSVRESLTKVFRDENYDVVEAADGQEAVERFTKGRIDLLVLDLGLPLKTGWDAFELITSEHPLVPIIIITGKANQYPVAVAAGVGALMEKPLDVPQLLQTMKKLLAEPLQTRLRRLCGYTQDVHHLSCDSALFLKQLREQYSTPLHFKLAHKQQDSR